MRYYYLLLLCLLPKINWAQGQIVRGTVIDEASQAPVRNASVLIPAGATSFAATSDSLGSFTITHVPFGRYDVQVTAMGYELNTIREVEVEGSKEVLLNIALQEANHKLGETVIRQRVSKEKPLNNMATLSARMLSVDEAKRYAGGFDDPSRLVSSFAGVASNISDNGIVVRGNSPKYLQWKMEGIEIPNPNHFADLATLGGGGLTALSAHMLANSDFFTGAFPGEYGNALSGVFDIFMRNGNNQKSENTFQAGFIGLDASAEGPFRKGGTSSYLFNYRYSTLGLVGGLLPPSARGVRYQDFSFKLNFPTRSAGVFSLWGISLLDKSGSHAITDTTQWQYQSDREQSDIYQYMAATGLAHKYVFNNNTFAKTTLALTLSGVDLTTNELGSDLKFLPENKVLNRHYDYTLSSFINRKFSWRHINRTGILLRGMAYDLNLQQSPQLFTPLQSIVHTTGFTSVVSAYSNSSIFLTRSLLANVGLNTQLFTLNGHYTIEPRAGIKYALTDNQALAFAYGLHSRLEAINYYFNRSLTTGLDQVNRNMDFTKAHHFVLGYDNQLGRHLHFKVEAYYQYLFNVPVIADSSFSFINLQNDWFFAEKLVNKGAGKNYGIDLTLEKYLSHGYYYLVTASIFNATYQGGDGVWRSSRYNRNYLCNFLTGKEWRVGQGQRNAIGLNIRFMLQGGDHYSPVDEAATRATGSVVYNESQAFSLQLPPSFIAHFTASYRVNRKHTSHELALKVLNFTGQKDFYGFKYNYITGAISKDENQIFVPNLSYRIDF